MVPLREGRSVRATVTTSSDFNGSRSPATRRSRQAGADGVRVRRRRSGKGGTVSLYVDGEKNGEGRVEGTAPSIYSADETCDVGSDTASPVSDDYTPEESRFNGTVGGCRSTSRAAEDLDHLITPGIGGCDDAAVARGSRRRRRFPGSSPMSRLHWSASGALDADLRPDAVHGHRRGARAGWGRRDPRCRRSRDDRPSWSRSRSCSSRTPSRSAPAIGAPRAGCRRGSSRRDAAHDDLGRGIAGRCSPGSTSGRRRCSRSVWRLRMRRSVGRRDEPPGAGRGPAGVEHRSGLNDGLALPFSCSRWPRSRRRAHGPDVVEVFLAIARAGGSGRHRRRRLGARRSRLSGARMGRRRWNRIATLGLVLLAFATADAMEAAGSSRRGSRVAFGRSIREMGDVSLLAEDLGALLAESPSSRFGAVLLGPLLGELSWEVLLYATLSLTVVRMLPVAVSFVGASSLGRPSGSPGGSGRGDSRRSCSGSSYRSRRCRTIRRSSRRCSRPSR